MNQPSKFRVNKPRPVVDMAQIENFASGAGNIPALPEKTPVPVAQPVAEPVIPAFLKKQEELVAAPESRMTDTMERTKHIALRLKPSQFARMEQVFNASTFKSKQLMGEKLLLDAIEEMALKLGI